MFKQSGANGATTTTASGAGPTTTSARTTSTAGSSGGGTVIDDFKDADTTEYRQLGTVNASLVNTPTERGSTALKFTNMYLNYGLESTSGLPNYSHQGDKFRVWFRFDGASQGHRFELSWGADGNGQHYSTTVRKQASGNDWDVSLQGAGSTNVGTTTVSLSPGSWYALEIAWRATDITLDVLDSNGSSLGSTTVSSTGDDGSDYVMFKADTGSNSFRWGYARIVGQA